MQGMVFRLISILKARCPFTTGRDSRAGKLLPFVRLGRFTLLRKACGSHLERSEGIMGVIVHGQAEEELVLSCSDFFFR